MVLGHVPRVMAVRDPDGVDQAGGRLGQIIARDRRLVVLVVVEVELGEDRLVQQFAGFVVGCGVEVAGVAE